MRRNTGRTSRILLWVLSVIIAISMACGFISYLRPARSTPTNSPTATPLMSAP